MSKFNFNDHFKSYEDDYLLSPAATLSLIGEATCSPDTPLSGKARALTIVGEVLKEGRTRRFAQIDVLETLLLRPSDGRRRLMLCDSLIKHIGNDAFKAALQRGGFPFLHGDQS